MGPSDLKLSPLTIALLKALSALAANGGDGTGGECVAGRLATSFRQRIGPSML